ncbi:MAG: aminotransferase class I/II-fold pyridoxal phosphate-dependent enzyme [Deltaproteobacteria bacterium]|jgi:threonine-phosphate decarboxylase|nr:aminotransferase class I/II-fold pyridoxal phosphate-dependent enzyme [Deltaproteobacteria bacterium]
MPDKNDNSLEIPAHGGRIFEASETLKTNIFKIIDFSANLNPFGQPKKLKEYVCSEFLSTIHYPEEKAQSMVSIIANFYDMPEEHFLPGAGSTVHIYILGRLLADGLCVILGPAFSEYEAAINAAGGKYVYVNAEEEDHFRVTPKIIAKIMAHKPQAIFLANPANPTGLLIPENILNELATIALDQKIYLVVDEAFIDFTTAQSLVPLVETNEYLVVLKSLTKTYAIPGLRLAYLVASPSLVERLWIQLGPWPLSALALSAADFIFLFEQYIDQLPNQVAALKKTLTQTLSLYGQPLPSDANFVLFKYSPEKVDQLIQYLYKNCLLVRDARNFNGLSRGWLRLAVRPQKELIVLAKLLEKFHA